MKRRSTRSEVLGLACVGLVAIGLCGCSPSETTAQEVCAKYGNLIKQIEGSDDSDFFNNEVFDAADELAEAAQGYPGDSAISDAGDELEDVAGRQVTTGMAMLEAAGPIVDMCEAGD